MDWRAPWHELLAEQYDIIMPDAQGHGLADRIDPGFSFLNHAHQVLGLVRELDIANPIIMGHSMGAGTAINIAVNYPEVPRAIILEDPPWRGQETIESGDEDAKAEQRKAFMEALAGFGSRTREELIAICRETSPPWSEAEVIPSAESKPQFDPAVLASMQIDRPFYIELVPAVTCPGLLITSDSELVAAATARHACSLSTAAQPLQWVEIKGAGHNIRREQFKTYCGTLRQFLGGL